MASAMIMGPLLASLLVLLAASSAFAQVDVDVDADRRASEVSSQLLSPFCPGRTLDTCSSPRAADWRREIRTWAGEGVPTKEIKARLEARAGRSLMAAPPSGQGYLIGAVTGLASLILLLVVVRRLMRRDNEAEGSSEDEAEDSEAASGAEAMANDSAYDERVDQELAMLDK